MARRAQEEIRQELVGVESIIRGHPEGISLQAIMDAFQAATNTPLSRSTMVRRLRALQTEGRIRSEGLTQAARYFVTPPKAAPETIPEATTPAKAAVVGASATGGATASAEADVPLTAEGREVRALVQQPMITRAPVGYNENLLRDYQPGKTWYLTEPMRARLHERGRTPDADRAAGTFAHEIYERLLIDLAWASSLLEGNTYTRLDTKNLLEYGVRAEGKAAADAQMILNHKKAIELLVNNAEEVDFDRHTIFNLHAALAENLLTNPEDEGRLRKRVVGVTGTAYVPLSIPQKIEELFDLMLEKARDIPDPFEKAFFVMVHLPYLQPFTDVNKRTSRLAANIPLIKTNLCPLSFVGLPHSAYVDGTLGVYELNRVELLRDVFMLAYERSCAQYRVVRESMEEPDPIRFRYRVELGELIRDTVLAGEPPQLESLRSWARAHSVPEADQERFAETALSLLLALHDGSISRYNLRPSEFEKWKKKITASRVSRS